MISPQIHDIATFLNTLYYVHQSISENFIYGVVQILLCTECTTSTHAYITSVTPSTFDVSSFMTTLRKDAQTPQSSYDEGEVITRIKKYINVINLNYYHAKVSHHLDEAVSLLSRNQGMLN